MGVMTFFVDFSNQRVEQLIYFIRRSEIFPEWNTSSSIRDLTSFVPYFARCQRGTLEGGKR